MQRQQREENKHLTKPPEYGDVKHDSPYHRPYLPIGYFERTLPIVFDSPDDPITLNIDQIPKLTVSTDPSDSSQHMLSAMAKCSVSYRGITASTYGSATKTFRDAETYGHAYTYVIGTAQAYAKKRALGLLGARFRVPESAAAAATVVEPEPGPDPETESGEWSIEGRGSMMSREREQLMEYTKKRAVGVIDKNVPGPYKARVIGMVESIRGHGSIDIHVDKEKEFMLRWDVIDTGKRALDARNSMVYMREMASCFIQCVYDPDNHKQLGHFASAVITHATKVIDNVNGHEEQHVDNAVACFHQFYVGLTTTLATYESPKSHSLRLTQRVADRLYDRLLDVRCKPIRSIYPRYDPEELNDFLPYMDEPSAFCADIVYLYLKSVTDTHDRCKDTWDVMIDRVDEWIEHNDLLTGGGESSSSESDSE